MNKKLLSRKFILTLFAFAAVLTGAILKGIPWADALKWILIGSGMYNLGQGFADGKGAGNG